MKRLILSALSLLLIPMVGLNAAEQKDSHRDLVANTKGLIAFWDFKLIADGKWQSRFDPNIERKSYPISLRRILDKQSYGINDWPYQDEQSRLIYDTTGPLGHAVRFNAGYVYGSIARSAFDQSLLDIHGKQAFTMVAWVKFVGKHHLVAGIWDEGGWDKYGGRRQVALFSGLFRRQSVIAHISATGASSFPQSMAKGSQYARLRSIDGRQFKSNTWVAMAMSYDPAAQQVKSYLNGVMTPLKLNDPVTKSVYPSQKVMPANPFKFTLPLYAPHAFCIKYNGYDLKQGVSEHRLLVDLKQGHLTYERDDYQSGTDRQFEIEFDIRQGTQSLLKQPMRLTASPGTQVALPVKFKSIAGLTLHTRLLVKDKQGFKQIGSAIERTLQAGAPFTFGRALGLGSEKLQKGSQLYLDGVAVFNRVLSGEELKKMAFGLK